MLAKMIQLSPIPFQEFKHWPDDSLLRKVEQQKTLKEGTVESTIT